MNVITSALNVHYSNQCHKLHREQVASFMYIVGNRRLISRYLSDGGDDGGDGDGEMSAAKLFSQVEENGDLQATLDVQDMFNL